MLRNRDCHTHTQMPSYYALLHEPYAADLQIRIYSDACIAANALKRSRSKDAVLIRFRSNALDLGKGAGKTIYLAVTREDDGLRIHGAFITPAELRHYISGHYCETPCHGIMVHPRSIEGPFTVASHAGVQYLSPRTGA